jgi:hypothetical protein
VVPVPMHRSRLLRRRYNQAAEIARPLCAMAGRTYLPDTLVRRRDTDSQGGKSADGRRRNVAAAFAVPEGRRHRVIGRKVLLIDDVLTTGATAEGCARALVGRRRHASDTRRRRARYRNASASYMRTETTSVTDSPWPRSPSTPVRSAATAPGP